MIISNGQLAGNRRVGRRQAEEVIYEGYGPAGMAVMLEALTDNRNRTASDLRHLFSKHGGNLVRAAVWLGCLRRKDV